MEFEIRLSGAVEVLVGGRRSDLGSIKPRIALAALAWDAGRTVGVDTLIHRIWDENPPVKARETLHAHISRIRAALRGADEDAAVIVSRTNSYVMRVDPDRVDLRHYTSCVDQARALKGTDDERAALALLDRADGLWRGEPLAGISGSWPGHLRTTVAETRLVAAITRAEILVGAGRFTDAVPVLLPLVAERPVDEALVELLAVALHGSSRTAEAARLLQRTRQRVIRDSGLDAGRRLHRVQEGILAGTPMVALLREVGVTGGTAPRPPVRIPDNLPRDVPWVGRREELHRLTEALSEGTGDAAPVVTVESISGMGGVGKTALAVHLAHHVRHRYPDGAVFVHLGGHACDRAAVAPRRALTEILRLLGVPGTELPESTDELTALWRSMARDRRMLVILDDAADPDQVRRLLPGASPTAVVVTSRKRLPGLPGVRPVSLGVLPPQDAKALFLQRLGPRGGTTDQEVTDIVRICGHLPLAVEIAASRLLAHPSWTTTDLLAQLATGDGHLDELRDGERSLTHVFDLSYDALTVRQRLVFRRIGLHLGAEFGPYAVAALTGLDPGTAERVLEELLAHHLVSEPVPHRFTMHDLLRGYARSLIGTDVNGPEEQPDSITGRLVDFYLRAADAADRLAYSFRSRTVVTGAGEEATRPAIPEFSGAPAAERWLKSESANLLDTLEWLTEHGTHPQLAYGVHVLGGFLDTQGHLATAEPLHRRAVDHWSAAGDGAALARALLDLATVRIHRSRFEEAMAAAREAREIAGSLKDPELESECLHQMSIALWQTGQYAVVQSLQKQVLSFHLQSNDKMRIARSHNLLGIAHLHVDEPEKALESFQSALAFFSEAGNVRGRFMTLNNLGELLARRGRPEEAEHAYREAMGVAAGVAGRGERATLQMNWANVLVTLGRADEALALFGEVLPELRAVEDRRAEAIALNGTGRAYRAVGEDERALPLHVAALAVARRVNAVGEEIEALYDLAQAEQATGRIEQAMTHYADCLVASRRIGAPAEEARASRALARLRAHARPSRESGRGRGPREG
ncbi:SARP family transcriptional regulator [Streptomyces sp. SAT1]|uniref:AfsR/SARP family transcriptional regulator n=1 Tax=Streptomyces sp. SAT1 TaxID=1849967 RepID=UPI0007DDE2AF|nr:tetratricopeptide repeat protein [Streptomyces sp. SAT1]ANH92559.1 SARP family transcriptional regulator [Streptomyces sp. SAT1]